MSGRHKFSKLDATMTPARRARVGEIAEKLDADVARTLKRPPEAPFDAAEVADTTASARRKAAEA
jgi:hypothetical protein